LFADDVCDYDRASVSGLLRPFLSFGFYPLNLHSFNYGISPAQNRRYHTKIFA